MSKNENRLEVYDGSHHVGYVVRRMGDPALRYYIWPVYTHDLLLEDDLFFKTYREARAALKLILVAEGLK